MPSYDPLTRDNHDEAKTAVGKWEFGTFQDIDRA